LTKKNIKLFTICICSASYLISFSANGNPLVEGQVLIEGDSLENILDRKLRASGNASLVTGNKTI